MFDQIARLAESKGAWILGFAALLFALENLFPRARPLAQAHLERLAERLARWGRNLGLAGVNAILSPLIVIPLSAVAAQWAPDWRPGWWSGAGGLVLDLILLDLWIYWWHRANHEIPLLWRFHEVHHLDEFLDVTTALRFHAGEVVLSSLVRAAVIVALAVPIANVVVFEIAIMFAALFHHSNLCLPAALERPLSLVIVTPSIHWVHHHAIRKDTDSNYCTILSIWDRLFATRSLTARWDSMPIGVERRHEQPLWRLMLSPFRKR